MAAKPNPKDFQFRDRKNEQLSKLSGEVNGYDFCIDGCEDCEIVIEDHVAQIFVDYCKRCTIVIGAVSTSGFFRNCEECKFKVACGQLRTRDCVDCDFLVLVPGQPIIETSRGMKFGPLTWAYPGLEEHLEKSGLRKRLDTEGGRCRWAHIYDFSPGDPAGGGHWSALSETDATTLRKSFPKGATDREVPVHCNRDLFPDEVLEERKEAAEKKEVSNGSAAKATSSRLKGRWVVEPDASGQKSESFAMVDAEGVVSIIGSVDSEPMKLNNIEGSPDCFSLTDAQSGDELCKMVRLKVEGKGQQLIFETEDGSAPEVWSRTEDQQRVVKRMSGLVPRVLTKEEPPEPSDEDEGVGESADADIRVASRPGGFRSLVEATKQRLKDGGLVGMVALGAAVPTCALAALHLEKEGIARQHRVETCLVRGKAQLRIVCQSI